MPGFQGNQNSNGAVMPTAPMKRMVHGEEMAVAVRYLASNEAAYVTGQTLHVNGGMAMI
jgi:3-oxoacyl-[acyl-carrier protein] reductase